MLWSVECGVHPSRRGTRLRRVDNGFVFTVFPLHVIKGFEKVCSTRIIVIEDAHYLPCVRDLNS
jgi:hypothetical protein